MFGIEYSWIFLTILPIVAFLYASVGHGGASGYLAIMALFGFAPEAMKPTALLLNLFVAGIAFIHFAKSGHFNKKLFLVFAVTSIPCAFLGGLLVVDESVYKKILAVLLVVAIIRMLNVFGKKSDEIQPIKIFPGILSGGAIGFFSGLIGIGGGIILSPVILLLKWGNMKQAAAVSALFIWVNSAAGLGGQLSTGVTITPQAFILVGIAVVGGFLGGYLGSKKFNNKVLRYLLIVVLASAAIKLFFS